NLHVGWGEVGDGLPQCPAGGCNPGSLGASISFLAGPFTQAQMQAALTADAKSGNDATAVASLATGRIPAGAHFVPSIGDGRALGLFAAANGTLDGAIGFNSGVTYTYGNNAVPGQFDFIGIAEHEIAEVMGRIAFVGQTLGTAPNTLPNAFTTLDLFR